MFIIIVVYVFCSAGGLLLMKGVFNAGQNGENHVWNVEWFFHLLINGKFILGFLLYFAGFVLWLYMLSRYEMSRIFPIASGALYAGLLIGAALWLHEEVGWLRLMGVFLILSGILIVYRS